MWGRILAWLVVIFGYLACGLLAVVLLQQCLHEHHRPRRPRPEPEPRDLSFEPAREPPCSRPTCASAQKEIQR